MKKFGKATDVMCNIFKNNKPNETTTEIENTESKEWIWVEGYKGTRFDMTCNDYQYELGKRHDMPVDEDIVECSSGFHLCLKLKDVFDYYSIGRNNRFFKVRALVRKKDYDEYGQLPKSDSYSLFYYGKRKNKLVSKSIEFISECTIDEILYQYDIKNWTDEEKQRALEVGPEQVHREIKHNARVSNLVNLGYSIAFSDYIAYSDEQYKKACTVASQPGVSMDVKVLTIFCGRD